MPHIVDTTAARIAREANPYAREHLTPEQLSRTVTPRTWSIRTPGLGESLVYSCEGLYAGPTLFVAGGHHGDEPAGYIAAGILTRAIAKTGRIVVIPNANPAAIAIHHRLGGTGESDLNRCYRIPAHSRDANCPGAQHAAAILATVQAVGASVVVDLHECADRKKITDMEIFCFADTQADRELAAAIDLPVLSAPQIPTSFTTVTSTQLGITSIAVETRDLQTLGARVRGHVATVLRIAAQCGVEISLPSQALGSFQVDRVQTS